MSRFLNPRYEALSAYTPGEQPRDRSYVKLNTNEFPYPPAPNVLEVLTRESLADLRLYSDPEGRELREALAEFYKLSSTQVFLSNGSDDILNFAFMAFSAKGASFPSISYSFYPVFAQLHAVSYESIPLKPDFSIDPLDYTGREGLIVIANPNAPTGLALTRAQIRSILEANPKSLVLIDEAYIDFGGQSAVPLLSEFDNLLVVMTYSKSRAMAGARLGFALGSAAVIADLEKLKYSTNPYNVNRLTLTLGVAALRGADYYRDKCARIAGTRESCAQALRSLGFQVLPSKANFLFATRPGISGKALYAGLKLRGILVRHFDKALISDYIRISIGTPAQMQVFLQGCDALVHEERLL